MRVYLTPDPAHAPDNNGIGRIVHAQYKYLPEWGIEFTDNPEKADVIAAHAGTALENMRVDVAHCHGLYWTADQGKYSRWNHAANRKIVDTCRKAKIITVPSAWVRMCFERDMRVSPEVIGHGIDVNEWESGENRGYILWNKGRGDDVCDPLPAWELARHGLQVVSTFAPNKPVPQSMEVIGARPFDEMKQIVRGADMYLATTVETFGIGTLEAMACGVPILGYSHGGTQDIVTHLKDGYLVEPGNVEGLIEGAEYIRKHRAKMGRDARKTALNYDWENVIGAYAELYERAACIPEERGVSIVITNYNYAQYVGEAIESALRQNEAAGEIIIVDDGSTDNSLDVIGRYADKVRVIHQENQGVASARNRGIAEAQNPFIVCLDADDRIRPEFVQNLHALMIADRGLGIAYTGLGMIQPDGTMMRAQGWPPEFSWESQATVSVPPSNCIPSACMFRKRMWERAGGIRQEYAPGEDAEFWTRGLSVGFTAKRATNEALFEYRAHAGSASRTRRYVAIDEHMPWMRDHKYPMAAPADVQPKVRSYIAPLVSVIIPVGPGHEKYLTKAIESVIGQTVRDWELIVVNDTGKKFDDELLRAYPFAHGLVDIGGYGASFARNRGIEAARAPLVLFLDADDYLRGDAIEQMLHTYTEKGQYVYSDFSLLREDGSIEPKITMDYNRTEFLKRQVMHSATALVPTEWARDVGGFDISLPGWEEYDFYMKLAKRGYCGARVPEPVLIYRDYSGTRRKASWEHEKELKELFRKRYPEDMKMSGCCGGNADSILEAKRVLGMMEDVMSEVNSSVSGMTLIEFTGDWSGPVTFKANGREYQGANSPLYKYQHVPDEDAVILVRTGKFKVVEQAAPKANVQAEQTVSVPDGPTITVSESVEKIENEITGEVFVPDEYPPAKQKAPVVEKATKRTRRHA